VAGDYNYDHDHEHEHNHDHYNLMPGNETTQEVESPTAEEESEENKVEEEQTATPTEDKVGE
jgi:hypothetical protein